VNGRDTDTPSTRISAGTCAHQNAIAARARVAIAYKRNEEAARSAAAEVTAAGAEAIALRADLANPAEADRLVTETLARFGRLDVAVVNQGIWKRAPLVDMTDEEWQETLAVNLTGAWAVSRAAARAMAPRGSGSLILIASTAGQRGEAWHSHYAASKGAVIAFTRSLAPELAPLGIRVNAVAPGWVLTDMTREALEGPGGTAALRPIPRGRAGTPEEAAGAVAFLASDLASYVFGEVLCVNGGSVMVG
jgi:3-oxoacyl-[acyl-carrier protein] reductase